MKTQWQIKDLIDLEYYLSMDAVHASHAQTMRVDARDRRIYLDTIRPNLTQTKPFPRRFVIKSWLERRREMEQTTNDASTPPPGESFAELFRLLQCGLFILGGLIGIVLAFSLLNYTGTAPLNVSVYMGFTVLAQILLLLLLFGLLLIRLIRPRLFYTSAIYTILSRLMLSLAGKLKRRVLKSVSGARRQGLTATIGMIQGKKQVYGTLFYWPFFNSMQLFGIGLNLGILGATLLRVAGTDMAFGWQSTVQFSAAAVYLMVKWLAIPWAWMVSPDLAHPTLAQIEGSRLILKDGIYSLATPDLVAWWPFLCFAVLFYGLLPRLVLFIMGKIAEHYLLNKIRFTHAACDQLIDRLTLPRVRFEPSQKFRPPPTAVTTPRHKPAAILDTDTQKRYAVLIPDDFFDMCATADLNDIIEKRLGGQMATKIRINQAEVDHPAVPDQLFAIGTKHNNWTHLLILQEAWQPPITEDLAFLKSLRQQLGSHTPILVGLIGKPNSKTIFTTVSPVNRQTWQKHLASIGDPYLRLEDLVYENL